MLAPPTGHFHLDHPAPAARVQAGPVCLRGWALAAGGQPFVDLRAQIDGRLVPGVLGFPRPDLARHFGSTAPHLPGGFEVTAHLAPGIHLVRFEACPLDGTWHPLAEISLEAHGPDAAAVEAGIIALDPADFAAVLRQSLRKPDVDSAASAAAVAGSLPHPAVLRYAHRPFHGHLHHPTLVPRCRFGRMHVEGWLFHEAIPIRRIAATVDLQAVQPLARSGSYEYVAAMFPKFPSARECRFSGMVDVPAQLPRPVTLRLYAELADGSWHLCHVQRATPIDHETEKSPLPAGNPVAYAAAAWRLRRRLANRRFSIPPRVAWDAWRAVLAERPGPAPQAPGRPSTSSPPELSHRPLPSATLVSHNLNREGAPLFLLDLAAQLAAGGTRLQVIAGRDGPLRDEFARLGASVTVVMPPDPRRALTAELARLAREAPSTAGSLFIVNTLSAWWGVHLAYHARQPALFYIHESTTPAAFYRDHYPRRALREVERSFALATHVSFLTESTRRYYRNVLPPHNHSLNPGWINVAQIDRFMQERDRAGLRRELAVDDDTLLVVNVGTVCDRKGQHIFARAVDQLWRLDPSLAARARFLMIGGRETAYDQDMADLLAELQRPNLQLVPESSNPLTYYGAADLFVCSSYEESFPRVVLEAMACRVPILSTGVHGVVDMLRDQQEGQLVAPGDTHALALGLAGLLRDVSRRQAYAQRARARVVAEFDAAVLLPRHAALAAAVAAGGNHA